MAPKKRKATQSTDEATQRKKAVPSLELYLIECQREVEVSEFDAKVDNLDEEDYDSDDADCREIKSKKQTIIEFAREGKELGSWFATDDEGNVLVFSDLEKANEYAQTVWIQMQFDDANDEVTSDDEDDEQPESFRHDGEALAKYSRERTFVVDPDSMGEKHTFTNETCCTVIQAKHME
jgi:hypothetical protein